MGGSVSHSSIGPAVLRGQGLHFREQSTSTRSHAIRSGESKYTTAMGLTSGDSGLISVYRWCNGQRAKRLMSMACGSVAAFRPQRWCCSIKFPSNARHLPHTPDPKTMSQPPHFARSTLYHPSECPYRALSWTAGTGTITSNPTKRHLGPKHLHVMSA